MIFKFVLSHEDDRSIPHEGSFVTESSLKIANGYIQKRYFRSIWIQFEDGTKVYLSPNPVVSNLAYDAMSDHE